MKNLTQFYVYIYFDPDTDLPYYVGKGSKLRYLHLINNAKQKKHHQKPAVCKTKQILDNDKIPKIEILSCDSEQESFQLEFNLIKVYGKRSDGGSLLNIADGGLGSAGHISPRRGKTNEEYFGNEKSTEISEKISQSAIARREQIIETNKRVHTGKKLTLEQREHLSKFQTGRVKSQETCLKISNATKGVKKTLSPEQLQNKSEAAKLLFSGMIYVNKNSINKRIKLEELSTYLEDGWVQGKIHKKKRSQNSSFTISEAVRSHPRGPKRCSIDGIVYETIKAAAIALSKSEYFVKKLPTFTFLVDDSV